MRDLYSRIGIEQTASEQEIRSAISNCNSAVLKEDAAEVLLVAARRRGYDRVHSTLCDIGRLRSHLGLNHGDNWRSPESDDFSKDPTHTGSMHDDLVLKVRQLNKKAKARNIINSIKALFYGTFRLAVGIAGFAAFIWVISISDKDSNSNHTATSSHNTSNSPAFDEPELPLPASGTIRRYTGNTGVAPLEIKTSSGANYLVKLEDISTGRNILDVFIRGGSVVNVKVPLGTYRLEYAAGKKWYGYQHYFGPRTSYSKADSTFRFYKDEYRFTGYTVTLYQVVDGNLRTSHLSPSEF